MRAPRHALVLGLLALAAPAGAVADGATELRRVEARRQQASVDADVPALAELLGDELRFVHASGNVATKAALIESLRSGRVDYVSIRAHDVEARVYGDAGVVTGAAELEVRAGGGPVQTLANLFTAVYARRDGVWRLVAYQSTPSASGR
jgi:ketosteroid isomerase-like protein